MHGQITARFYVRLACHLVMQVTKQLRTSACSCTVACAGTTQSVWACRSLMLR